MTVSYQDPATAKIHQIPIAPAGGLEPDFSSWSGTEIGFSDDFGTATLTYDSGADLFTLTFVNTNTIGGGAPVVTTTAYTAPWDGVTSIVPDDVTWTCASGCGAVALVMVGSSGFSEPDPTPVLGVDVVCANCPCYDGEIGSSIICGECLSLICTIVDDDEGIFEDGCGQQWQLTPVDGTLPQSFGCGDERYVITRIS